MTTAEYYCTQCPECNSSLVQDYSKGEYICNKCGYVVVDQVDDYGRESNSTDFEEKSKNVRASGTTSLALHDYGLRTEIAYGSKDYAGKQINYQVAEQMNSIRKWHARSRIISPKERRLSNVLTKINETCACMGLPKTMAETAAMFYRNFENKCEAKGKSISCIAAAAIYLACKKCSIVRSLDEIVKATGITEQDRSNIKLASKYYRTMVMEMGAFSDPRTNKETATVSTFVPVTANTTAVPQTSTATVTLAIDQYISKLSNTAKIDIKVERLAIDIAHKTDHHMLADGKAPNGLAAAYIYIASILLGVNVLQRDVSSLSGVTEVTIRNRCKDILTNFKLTLLVKPLAKSTTT
jgi:transcription initiation factor TFIIB